MQPLLQQWKWRVDEQANIPLDRNSWSETAQASSFSLLYIYIYRGANGRYWIHIYREREIHSGLYIYIKIKQTQGEIMHDIKEQVGAWKPHGQECTYRRIVDAERRTTEAYIHTSKQEATSTIDYSCSSSQNGSLLFAHSKIIHVLVNCFSQVLIVVIYYINQSSSVILLNIRIFL